MQKSNLVEYSHTYSKTLGSLWEHYRDEPALNNSNVVIDFSADSNNNISFKLKQKIAGQTGNNGKENVKIMVPLNYLSNFWKALEILLVNCEISLILTQSRN